MTPCIKCEAFTVGAGGTVTAASMAVSCCPACRCPGVPLSWRAVVLACRCPGVSWWPTSAPRLPDLIQSKRLHRDTVHQVRSLHRWSWWHRHCCQHGRELLPGVPLSWRAVVLACRCPGVPLSWRELVANVSTSTRCKPFNVGAGASVTAWRAVARDRCHFCDCYEKPLPGNDRPA